ncbi:hypothetical protein P280DRAFT_482354 [Massarina eburnea CBS 473.64]|uniref:Uncharacterized protein n=1 Tax=Massarina eburnea CBS 473.64 TaxID=1395130 RepID=A0A6A6RRD3_9PLEO|nr:hypothetical protein P280DRAFT_482354 [Massarina eburnea CBS 473.64]
MRFSTLLAVLLSFACGILAAPSAVVLDLAPLVKKDAAPEPIPIPTLVPASSSFKFGKRDDFDYSGWAIVKDDDKKYTMKEPKGHTYCWFLQDTDKKEKAVGTKVNVREGSICYFYEKPCDPGNGKAWYTIGNITNNEDSVAFPEQKIAPSVRVFSRRYGCDGS